MTERSWDIARKDNIAGLVWPLLYPLPTGLSKPTRTYMRSTGLLLYPLSIIFIGASVFFISTAPYFKSVNARPENNAALKSRIAQGMASSPNKTVGQEESQLYTNQGKLLIYNSSRLRLSDSAIKCYNTDRRVWLDLHVPGHVSKIVPDDYLSADLIYTSNDVFLVWCWGPSGQAVVDIETNPLTFSKIANAITRDAEVIKGAYYRDNTSVFYLETSGVGKKVRFIPRDLSTFNVYFAPRPFDCDAFDSSGTYLEGSPC